MKKVIQLISPDKKSFAKIDNGELVSYVKNSEELIHQKGDAGWANSDTEMFPIIGPTVKNSFKVSTQKGDNFQDQHGLLRELSYVLLQNDEHSVSLQKKYKAGEKVENSKFPERSTQENLVWLYNFKFTKSINLTNDSLSVHFEFETEKGMPFMLGYHPAFKLSGKATEVFKWKENEVGIEEVIRGGHSAYPVLDTQEIYLIKGEGYRLKIKTENFDNFMIWSPTARMVCIEPITQYPEKSQIYSEDNMKISSGKEEFSVEIVPY